MTISKVMIVDDDEDVRTVSEVVARRVGGWDVTLAASGEEALELAPVEKPDVILLDVMMPGLDGPQTLEQLRKRPATATIPVIFLTARARSRDVEHYLSLGADGVLVKPFDAMTLPDQVRRIVDGRSVRSPDPDVAAEIALLRTEYMLRLPDDLAQLEALIREAVARESDASLTEADALAHKLKGTTGFYRLVDVSSELHRVEDALREIRRSGTPALRTAALERATEALSRALRSLDQSS